MAYRPPPHPKWKDKDTKDTKSLDKAPEVTIDKVDPDPTPDAGALDGTNENVPGTIPHTLTHRRSNPEPGPHQENNIALEHTASGALPRPYFKTLEGKQNLEFLKVAATQNAQMVERRNFEGARKPELNFGGENERPTPTIPESVEDAKREVRTLLFSVVDC